MARRLFTFLSALSLLLCTAMAVLWVRSHHYWLYKGVTFNSTRRADGGQFHYCVSTHPLGITISHHRLITAPLKTGWLPFSARCAPITRESLGDWYRADGGDGLAGIWWLFDAPRGDGSGSMYQLFIPHWLALLGTAALPILWAVQWWQKHRRPQQGLCRSCGYDLRATPGRCPECGTLPVTKEA